jgi:outer membrane receptor protein involved in Fe transport
MYRKDNSSLGQYPSWYFYDDPDAIWGETLQRGVLRYDTTSGDFDFSTRLSYLSNRLDNESYFSFIFPTIDPSTFGQRNRAYKYQASDEATFEEIVTWTASDNLEIVSGFQGNYIGQLPKTNDLSEPFDESSYDPFSTGDLPASSLFGQFGNNPKRVNQWGLFTQALYSVDEFVGIAGVRYDRNSRFGSTVNPRAGIRYNLDSSTSFNFNYAQAYKAPSPYFEFNSVAVLNADGTTAYLGVPSEGALDPEEFESFELGARRVWSSSISTDITFYRNKIDNLLYNVQIPLDAERYPNSGGPTGGAFVNAGDSKIEYWGADFVLRARNLIPSIGFGADLFATYTTGDETFPAGAGTSDGMRNQPEWSAKLRLSATPVENLTVGLDNQWFDDWYYRGLTSAEEFNTSPDARVKGNLVMDFYSTYDATDNVTLYFEVENVLDEDYFGVEAYRAVSLPGNPQQGRNFFGGIQISFQ